MRVGIVGAGIGGLALTHYLAERGVDSIAFEASPEAGGVIRSRTVDGHVLETGPQRMRLTPGVETLAEAAGLGDDIVEAGAEDLYVYAGGELGLAPLTKRQLLETDLLSLRGKARLLAEPLTRPGRPEETVAALFRRKFGDEAYTRFIGPLYGGIYGSDPAEMPAAFALEGLLERERETGSLLRAFTQRVGGGHQSPPVAFAGGNQQLPAALARVYSDRLLLETPVTAIRPSGDGVGSSDEHSYTIVAAGETYECDAVVVTTPAAVTADLLAGLESAGATGLDGLSLLRYNPLAMVFLEATTDRRGKGYQVAFDEDLHTLGVSWNGSMFDRDGVHTVFLGGMHDPAMLERSDDAIAAVASEEFERVMDAVPSVIDVARLRPGFPAWDQSWWALEDLELPAGVRMATNYTGRMGIPSRVREAREIASDLASDVSH